ncbi:Receptor-type guanylate cyclase gcy-12 [Hondaea fermentalgiana]|uniref:Receptor-type guanylate cyclase gcy-12 n=1 Tax=Hondaea fermentalgiana TaxID=2315210 RepID=A0A2R5GAE7_9STRA|nr:Receptor-type guanylate cyclase gcy-12 [Hondaea fermentalgiana]|eukprot:GBG27565.1 Receptor-type guanylate cyclase gcy-12 [Hondaea fermentalgiana]
MSALRVVSLLPSATEALCEVGGAHLLVGRSHECDWPPQVQHLPVLTAQKTTFTTPREVDDQVRSALANNESLYTVNAGLLKELKPDVIITQSLCQVCSIDMNEVVQLARQLDPRPRVISLNPHTLDEVLESLNEVGNAVGLAKEAVASRARLQARVDAACQRVAASGEPRFRNIAFIEWPDPIYVGGHWTPEILRMAGARQGVNDDPGSKSFAIPTERLQEDDPDAIIVCPCGLDLAKTESLTRDMESSTWWPSLRAVQQDHVALVDGNQMFNRPGPRLVDCLEWLVDWLHPANAAKPGAAKAGFPWKPYVRPVETQASPSETEREAAETKRLRDLEDLHQAAMERGDKTYTDPATGYMVFTAQTALDRGYCCGKACRHCPYGHCAVPADQRKLHRSDPIQGPRLLRARPVPRRKRGLAADPDAKLRIVFWSGGKDSFLTYLRTRETADAGDKIVLLTTFDANTNVVPEQEVPLSDIMDQARSLDVDLLVAPLPRASANTDYVETVERSLELLLREYNFAREQVCLVFGDLHLEDIRAWRAANFASWRSEFPLFKVPYAQLEQQLWTALDDLEATVTVSACNIDDAAVSTLSSRGIALETGTPYTAELVDRLKSVPNGPDTFGECGEFHTIVRFPDPLMPTQGKRDDEKSASERTLRSEEDEEERRQVLQEEDGDEKQEGEDDCAGPQLDAKKTTCGGEAERENPTSHIDETPGLSNIASSPPLGGRGPGILYDAEKRVAWTEGISQAAMSAPADLEAQDAVLNEEFATRMARTQSVMASVQKRMHSLSQLGQEIDMLTPGDASSNGPVLDQAAWAAAAGLASDKSDSMYSTGRWSAGDSRILGRRKSKLEIDIERNIRQNRERTCWCLCNRAAQFQLRDAIMYPFMALVLFGAIIIIVVQHFFTQRIQDTYEQSCNSSLNVFINTSLFVELDNSRTQLASTLQTTVSLIDLSIISDSFQTILSTLTLMDSLQQATDNTTLISSLTSNMLFQTLNSSFVSLVAGGAIVQASTFGTDPTDIDPNAFIFDRQVVSESFTLALSESGNDLMLWELDRTDGSPIEPGQVIPLDAFSLSGLSSQLHVLSEAGNTSRSFGAYTNFGYWLDGYLDPSLTYGFLLTYPINFCGTYSCFQGYAQTNVLTSAISAVSVSVLRSVQNESAATSLSCPQCAQFFYVLKSVPSIESDINQTGLLVGGAVDGRELNITAPVFATNYTESEIVRQYTNVVENLNLEANESITVIRNASDGTLCNVSDDDADFDANLDQLYRDCVVLTVGPLSGESTDDNFPVLYPFIWRAVLAVPVSWSIVNYTNALQEPREQLQRSTEETNQVLQKLAGTSAGVEVGLILLTLVLSYVIAALLARPIRRLTSEIRRLTKLEFRNKGAVMPREERSRIKEVARTQREFVKMYYALETFARFVPAAVVRNILRTKRGRRLNVKERVVTTMFSDIQGFTSIAEKLERVDLMYLITRYLTAMTAIVEQYEGVVAEIQGDGLLAFWNTPETIEDHATKALSAAIAQQQYLRTLSVQFQEEFKEKYDLGEFRVRIGIHTGPVLSGTIGSLTKYKFGSLGDAVNMASRLEGLSKLYGTQIICSEDTLSLCAFRHSFLLRELDLVQVKGKEQAARIFEVVLQKEPIECKFLAPYVATETDSDSDSESDGEEDEDEDEDADGESDADEQDAQNNAMDQRRKRRDARASADAGKRDKTRRRQGKNSKFFFTSFRPLLPKAAPSPPSRDSDASDSPQSEPLDQESSQGSHLTLNGESNGAGRTLYATPTMESQADVLKSFHPVTDIPMLARETARINRYEVALHAFQEGRFRNAERTLLSVSDLDGDLNTAETLLLERTREQLERFGVDAIDAQELGWTGVNTLASKSF